MESCHFLYIPFPPFMLTRRAMQISQYQIQMFLSVFSPIGNNSECGLPSRCGVSKIVICESARDEFPLPSIKDIVL